MPPDNLGDTVEIMELLQRELQETHSSLSAKDRKTASDRDILDDIHGSLFGNGDPTKGIVYRVAKINVEGKMSRKAINKISDDLETQIKFCKNVQEEKKQYFANKELNLVKETADKKLDLAKETADKKLKEVQDQSSLYKGVGSFVLKYKYLLSILALFGIFYIYNIVLSRINIQQSIDKAIDQKFALVLNSQTNHIVKLK